MPGPSVVVTLTDADGDAFPIRLMGAWERTPPKHIELVAREELDKLTAAGRVKPTMPVSVTEVEHYGL